jgi:hypothetical protein
MHRQTPQHRSVLDPQSSRLPNSPVAIFIRRWLPAIVCLIGIVIGAVEGFDATGFDATMAFLGAGCSIWLINFLWRLGVSGDDERDREESARAYLAEHGRWPDEDE